MFPTRHRGVLTVRTTAARRAIVGTALAIGLPLAAAGIAAAQSAPSGPGTPSQPSGPSAPPAGGGTTTTVGSITTPPRPAGSGLARTGNDAALPLAASAAAITIVLGGRRLASRLHG